MFSFYSHLPPARLASVPCLYPGCNHKAHSQESRMKHVWAEHLASTSILQTALLSCYECNCSFATEYDKTIHMSTLHPSLKHYNVTDFQRALNTPATFAPTQRYEQQREQPPAGPNTSLSLEDEVHQLRPYLFCPLDNCSTGANRTGFSSDASWKRHKNMYHRSENIQPVRRD